MYLRNLFFLLTTVYLFSFNLFSKTEYLQCDTLIFKIKKPLVGFKRGYVKEKNNNEKNNNEKNNNEKNNNEKKQKK